MDVAKVAVGVDEHAVERVSRVSELEVLCFVVANATGGIQPYREESGGARFATVMIVGLTLMEIGWTVFRDSARAAVSEATRPAAAKRMVRMMCNIWRY